jgi:heme/copper-type cytochrome/quinol oxidase subunit 2
MIQWFWNIHTLECIDFEFFQNIITIIVVVAAPVAITIVRIGILMLILGKFHPRQHQKRHEMIEARESRLIWTLIRIHISVIFHKIRLPSTQGPQDMGLKLYLISG